MPKMHRAIIKNTNDCRKDAVTSMTIFCRQKLEYQTVRGSCRPWHSLRPSWPLHNRRCCFLANYNICQRDWWMSCVAPSHRDITNNIYMSRAKATTQLPALGRVLSGGNWPRWRQSKTDGGEDYDWALNAHLNRTAERQASATD